MKITKLRHVKTGKTVSLEERVNLANQLQREFDKAGFYTDVNDEFTTIGLGGKCFTIDVDKLGYNARVNNGVNGMGQTLNYMGPVGFKRTSLPTWDQRVEFNQIVQRVLNKNGVTATVKSGPFVISKDGHNYTENDWLDVAESTVYGQNQVNAIQPLTKAMIKHAKEIRKQVARERRLKAKQSKPQLTLVQNMGA